MKKAVIYGIGDLRITEMEIPRVTPGKVLIRISFCSVCGSDLHILEGHFPVPFPYFPGHECSGIVAEVGEGVNMFKKGDRVVWVPMANPCGKCVFCRMGKDNFCPNRRRADLGGFAEYALMEERQIYILPDGVPLDQGSLMEPLSVALHAGDLAEIQTGDRVLIIGGGAIGLLVLQVVRMSGARTVLLSEPDEQRRKLAKQLGAHIIIDPRTENLAQVVQAHTDGMGVDVVLEAAGVVEACEQSVELVRRGGRVIFVGVVPQGRKISLTHFDIFFKELVIKGVNINFHIYQRAVNLLPTFNLNPLLTHTFDLERLPEALETFKRRGGIKLSVRC